MGKVYPRQIMKWILKLANLGKIKWQIRAAKEYRKGKITRRKWKKSYYWMNKAAMQGDPKALFQLGKYCMKGLGTLQDHVRAYALLNVSCALKPIPKRIRFRDRFIKRHPDVKIPGQKLFRSLMEEFQWL